VISASDSHDHKHLAHMMSADFGISIRVNSEYANADSSIGCDGKFVSNVISASA
jgi:hypothetical protein